MATTHASRAVQEKADALAEEVAWFLDANTGWGTLLKAVGYDNTESLARYLRRHRHTDLARRIEHLTQYQEAPK